MRDEVLRQYASRIDLLKAMADALEKETIKCLEGVEHIDRIYFRVKSPESFVNKALDPENDPPYEHPLVEIEDQVAGRIIVHFREDLDVVKTKLRGIYSTVEFERRRPPADEEFGYESNHLILIIPPQVKTQEWESRDDLPKTFEMQIRTIFMHAYAEPQHDLAYKSVKELPSHIRRELAWIAASSWGADQAYKRVYEWHKNNRQT
jgi:ppGpp synthetase/RelA/SpoT-type nucleotidyltranferase